jgi:glycosyltransferase involved in cell wall biosynthesis
MNSSSKLMPRHEDFLVSVVIPCLNESHHIESTVGSLLNGSVRQVEVVVVDGGSVDGTLDRLAALSAQDSRLVVLHNPHRITPISLNIGIQSARGEYIAILGAHSEPAPDWVEKNLQALEQVPEAIAVGGVLETISETGMGRVIAAVLSSPFGVGNSRFRTGGAPGFVDTVVFGCYRRRAFEYGFFDEQLATNQDDEFNIRLTSRGEKMYFDPSIHCRYFCRPTWKKLAKQYWRYGRYKMLVFKKAGRVGSFRQLVPALWVAFLAAGMLISPLSTAILSLTASVLALYGTLGLLTAASSRKQLGWRAVAFLPVAATVHCVYGAGLWCGFVKDVVLGSGEGITAAQGAGKRARNQAT